MQLQTEKIAKRKHTYCQKIVQVDNLDSLQTLIMMQEINETELG